MKKSKRALWVCVVGILGLGIWLSAGLRSTRSDVQAGGNVGYCPIYLYMYFNGTYYYVVTAPGTNCMPEGIMPSDVPHQLGCPDCLDPIFSGARPLPFPKSDAASELAPKPDPLFSGVLR
ncbi:MAG: hypothetical protein HY290_09495 [Planctomycetia bacterium]|nr:hypothetical protein [Planctomycetia bacterium]